MKAQHCGTNSLFVLDRPNQNNHSQIYIGEHCVCDYFISYFGTKGKKLVRAAPINVFHSHENLPFPLYVKVYS